MDLKAKNTSWKLINEAIEGKGGVQGLKDRFKELNNAENSQSKGEEAGGETGGETDKENKSKNGEDGNGKGNSKGKGKGKGSGEGKVAEPEKEVDGLKEKKVKGKGKEEPEEKVEERKQRIIYVDEDDGLTVKDVGEPQHAYEVGVYRRLTALA